jgi:hypothetical protein
MRDFGLGETAQTIPVNKNKDSRISILKGLTTTKVQLII